MDKYYTAVLRKGILKNILMCIDWKYILSIKFLTSRMNRVKKSASPFLNKHLCFFTYKMKYHNAEFKHVEHISDSKKLVRICKISIKSFIRVPRMWKRKIIRLSDYLYFFFFCIIIFNIQLDILSWSYVVFSNQIKEREIDLNKTTYLWLNV